MEPDRTPTQPNPEARMELGGSGGAAGDSVSEIAACAETGEHHGHPWELERGRPVLSANCSVS